MKLNYLQKLGILCALLSIVSYFIPNIVISILMWAISFVSALILATLDIKYDYANCVLGEKE